MSIKFLAGRWAVWNNYDPEDDDLPLVEWIG